MKDWHHYCQTAEVATQFCSFTRDSAAEEPLKQKQKDRKQPLPRKEWRWRTEGMENYSKSFSSLCVALAIAGEGSFDVTQKNIKLEYYYPIVVFQGPIYEARIKGGEVELRRTDHVQLHHAVAIGRDIFRAQIDVVSEHGFPDLIDVIKRELSKISEGIRRIETRLLNSATDQKQAASQRAPISSRC